MGKITVVNDMIMALDTDTQSYVFLPNKIVDENGLCPLFKGSSNCRMYAIFNLSGDPIKDSINKLKNRHGRSKQKQELEYMQASMLENKCYLHAQHAIKHQENVIEKIFGKWKQFFNK